MKLYDVPNGSSIRVMEDAKVAPGSPPVGYQSALNFSHVDGMYSYCTDVWGTVYHPAAWTEVEVEDETTPVP